MSQEFRNTIANYYTDIFHWHNVINGAVYEMDQEKKVGLQKLYVNLVNEELGEMHDGYTNGDIVEFLDGLFDSLWVMSYEYRLSGVGTKIFAEKHITEHTPTKSLPPLDSDEVEVLMHYVPVGGGELRIEILEELASIVDRLGVDVQGVCNEIYTSNMSKFPAENSVDPDKEALYIVDKYGDSGVTSCTYEVALGQYVFRDQNGKVRKPSTFKEPNLRPFINGVTF